MTTMETPALSENDELLLLTRIVCDKARQEPAQSHHLYRLAKANIQRMIDNLLRQYEPPNAIEAERVLYPAFTAIAELPELERGACYSYVRQASGGTAASEFQLAKLVSSVSISRVSASGPLVVESVKDILTKQIPPREAILDPWLPKSSLCLIHAWRGTGKSLFALGAALSIASGSEFLGWPAPKARKVLVVDGELPEVVIQERIAKLMHATQLSPEVDNLRYVHIDSQPNSTLPDLASVQGQAAYNAAIADADLVIVDNLSCLVKAGKENEAESWRPLVPWLLSLRSQGKAVILVHHSNKNGQQRGTSAKEDNMDTVICLKRPEGYSESSGAVFEVHFEKARHFSGADAESFLARYSDDGGWSRAEISPGQKDRIRELKNDGLTRAEVARRLGLHRSTVGRQWHD